MVLFPFLLKYYHIFSIIVVFRLVVINLSPVSSTVFSKGSVTGCDSSLGGKGMIFHFRLSKSILLFVNWNWLCFFYLIHSANMLCLLLLYLIRFYNALLSVSSQDFYCSLPNDQSRDDSLLGSFCYSPVYSFCVCIFIPATIITTM